MNAKEFYSKSVDAKDSAKNFVKKHWKKAAITVVAVGPLTYALLKLNKAEHGLTLGDEVTILNKYNGSLLDVVVRESDRTYGPRTKGGACSHCHETIHEGELFGDSRWNMNRFHLTCLQKIWISQRS